MTTASGRHRRRRARIAVAAYAVGLLLLLLVAAWLAPRSEPGDDSGAAVVTVSPVAPASTGTP